ncbi:MAG: phosphotransferase [Phycisphaerales bacterium]|nr:phosphotransferase [Phycisphaerales bacterium]
MQNDADNVDRTPRLGPLVDDSIVAEEIGGQDLAIVLSRYDIGSIERLSDYRKGSRRAAKMLVGSSKGKYLLKRRAVGNDVKDFVEFTHAVQKRLAEHRFPVAGLMNTVDGDTYVEHDNRIYELFSFIHGKRFDKTNPAAAESGRVLAHFHDILNDFPNEPNVKKQIYHQGDNFYRIISEVYDILEKHETPNDLEGVADTIGFIREQYEMANKKVDAIGFYSLPTNVVHGDWHPGNTLYKDGEIIAVIDFDSLRVSPRITDIANGALQFSMRMGNAEDVDKWPDTFRGNTIQSMVQAYDQFTKVPIMASERSIFPSLMIEALIAESIIPIHNTGSFGRVRGSVFLKMVERKLRWLLPREDRIIDVIKPQLSDEDSFS